MSKETINNGSIEFKTTVDLTNLTQNLSEEEKNKMNDYINGHLSSFVYDTAAYWIEEYDKEAYLSRD